MVRIPDKQTQSGIVWAYRFDAEGQAQGIPREEAPGLGAGHCAFVWIHLDLVHSRAKEWIGANPALPAEARECFLSQDNHQRLYYDRNLVWGITFDQIREVGSRIDETGLLHWIIGPDFLLTGRRQALEAVRLTRDAVEAGFRAESPVALFERLIEYVIEDVAEDVLQLTEDADSIEDHIIDERIGDEARQLGRIRRRTVRLHRQLGGLHQLFRRFADANSGRPVPETVRHAAGRLLHQVDTMLTDVQSVQQRARLLQDEIAAKLTLQTNHHLYVLSILTATLMPATLITGLFGVNTKGLPFLDNEWGFAYVLAISGAAALGIYLLLRRRRMIH